MCQQICLILIFLPIWSSRVELRDLLDSRRNLGVGAKGGSPDCGLFPFEHHLDIANHPGSSRRRRNVKWREERCRISCHVPLAMLWLDAAALRSNGARLPSNTNCLKHQAYNGHS
ncbi:hypothetical protein F5Y17DRAFT_411310 [Xylariaceae sp. FL0594]|nr:hypothetical protein F5Y17DRAFT_411310 [Xylariaceae sp. FL0594]